MNTERIKELLDELRDMPLTMAVLERVDEISELLDGSVAESVAESKINNFQPVE